ncbi:pyrimidine 5'-nucleotidase [Legionella hackeliae]|uniref:DUMP phosphatase n=1 Tax=Legionella hackeliae TaxID=449 RepID=A0A0A8UMJ8_LEGHA|nr:pyrimidine 5'-nucleotidase [Legionella hackeliae]KTD10570.1 haloacid dehalogenase [Legionella hackeliae]CEK10075.1 dUMP phosphatase [Legionella hackeliae]STX46799.1 haloacid dehalogenase [Legionella hackeliae]
MKTYQWILFDADDTLFCFDAFSGLQRVFLKFDVHFTRQDYQAYQVVNQALWVDYQNGSITAHELQHRRFNDWATKLRVSTENLNRTFLITMAELCTPLEGAMSLLNTLKGKARLGIITNGFTEMQQRRLDRTGLGDFFEIVVVSEQVGIAKPHRGIFEHALSMMGKPSPENVLMVGDNPDSDILGGLNAGFDTCWLNVHRKSAPEGINPHYEVASLAELEELLCFKTVATQG